MTSQSANGNEATVVAVINQVGYMRSSFTFQTKVETYVDVAVKGLTGNWTPSGSVKISLSSRVGNRLALNMPSATLVLR